MRFHFKVVYKYGIKAGIHSALYIGIKVVAYHNTFFPLGECFA